MLLSLKKSDNCPFKKDCKSAWHNAVPMAIFYLLRLVVAHHASPPNYIIKKALVRVKCHSPLRCLQY